MVQELKILFKLYFKLENDIEDSKRNFENLCSKPNIPDIVKLRQERAIQEKIDALQTAERAIEIFIKFN